MSKIGKVDFSCPKPRGHANCVDTSVNVNEKSSLVDESCLTQEEVNQDIYDQLKDLTDLSELGKGDCVDYGCDTEDLTIPKVLKKFEDIFTANKLCKDEEDEGSTDETGGSGGGSTSTNNSGIVFSDLDLSCLQDKCGQTITTPTNTIQALIDLVCSQQTTIEALLTDVEDLKQDISNLKSLYDPRNAQSLQELTNRVTVLENEP
jgi:hypothetical protein